MSQQLLGKPTPKILRLMEACRREMMGKSYVLASGCRFSTKTTGSLFCICEHAWQVSNANVAIIAVSQSAGLDSGIWDDLINLAIPSFGLQITKGPYVRSVSKKAAVEVRNQFGQTVTIQLESLKDEDEVEKRFKGKRYTMIYVPDLSNFKKRKTFTILASALRRYDAEAQKRLLFLGDTNPADEGDKSWIYKIWYELRAAETFDAKEADLRKRLSLVEFDLSDNIYSPREEIEALKAEHSYDPDLYARYILGKWVTASSDALFYGVFKPNIHVVGELATASNPLPLLLVPRPGCFQMGGGWDLGVVNSASAIIEKAYRKDDPITDIEGNKIENIVSVFNILDELVIVGEDFEMREYVEAMMKKRAAWENYVGRQFEWTDWSDQSAFVMKDPYSQGRYHHQEVYNVSGGRIVLQAALGGRTQEMLKQRINLFRKLLFQNRIQISAQCVHTIEMCQSIKRGKGQFSIIQKESRHKHIFDAITYYISSECIEEIHESTMRSRRPNTEESGVIAVSL